MSDTDGEQPAKAKDSLEFAESIVDTVREPLARPRCRPPGPVGQPLLLPDLRRHPRGDRGPAHLRAGQRPVEHPPAPDAPRRDPPQGPLVPRLRGRPRLRGHRPAADAPQRPQDLAGRQSLRADPARHRGRHRPLAGRGRTPRQPRAVPPHRRERHRLRHLHDRHARAWSPRWNPGAEKIFGYREAEMLGQDIRVIFTPEDRRGRPGGARDADGRGRGPGPG